MYKDNDSVNLIAKVFNTYYSSLHDISTTYASNNPAVLLRARGKIPLFFETSTDPGKLFNFFENFIN